MSAASSSLTERRAADRKAMAKAVADLARRYDCKVEYLEGTNFPGPRCIWVRIAAPGGLCLTVELDGNSCHPDVHVLSWHMDLSSESRLSPSFPAAVNRYHYQKATNVAHGFVAMMQALKTGLGLCRSGLAYQPQRSDPKPSTHPQEKP